MVEETRSIPDAVAAHARSRWSRPDTVREIRSRSGFIFHCREVVALVEFTEVNFTTGLGTPQTQRVGRVGVVTWDYLIVSYSQNLFGFNPARFYLPAECDHQNGLYSACCGV